MTVVSCSLVCVLMVGYTFALNCPSQWSYYDSQCWFMSNHKLNWSAATQECAQNYDASLATVETKDSSRIINRLDAIRSSTKTSEQLKSKFRSLPSHSTIVIEQCFHQKRGLIVVDRDEVISIGGLLTSTDCIYECSQARSTLGHECRSVLWRDSERDCLLNRRTQNETKLSNTKTIELTAEFVYFEDSYEFDEERQKDVELPHAQPVHNVRNCFNKHKNKILFGYADQIVLDVTERECLQLCYGQDHCKTANYYRSTHQCILTNVSSKLKSDYQISEPSADLFERRIKCQFESCEDLEVLIVFVVDPSVLSNSNYQQTTETIRKIVEEINEVTQFVRFALIQIEMNGQSTIKMDPFVFSDISEPLKQLNSTLRIVEQSVFLNQKVESNLNTLSTVLDIATNTKDVDLVWHLTLTDGSVVMNDSLIAKYTEIGNEAKHSRNFETAVIGIGAHLDYDNLVKIADERDLIHIQEPESVARELSNRICYLPRRSIQNKQLDYRNRRSTTSNFWIGLKRNQFGQMKWEDGTIVEGYVTNKIKQMEVMPEHGDCVLWSSENKWSFVNCSIAHQFVCTKRPKSSLLQKLKEELAN